MGKLGDTFRDGRIVGWAVVVAAGVIGGAVVGGVALNANAEFAPAAVIETVEPIDLATIPDGVNGLAAEQEAEAAAAVAAEQQRLAAEAAAAEAARVAAEQAAAAEAERVTAEQAAAEESSEEPDPAPAPAPKYTGPDPNTQSHTICEVLADGTQVPCVN